MLPLLAALMFAPSAPPLRVWKGPDAGGAWNVAANWDGGVVPQPGEIAYLGGTDVSRTITLSGSSSTVAGVFGGKTLVVDGTTLKITGNPVEVTSFEDARVKNSGVIDLAGPGRVQGGVALDGGALNITGTGVKLSGRFSGTGAARITGGVEADGVQFTTSSFENDGVLKATGLVDIKSPGTSDGRFELGATMLVRSNTTLAAGAVVAGPGRIEIPDATLQVNPGATFTPGAVATYFPGKLALDADATVGTVEQRGLRTGSGTLRATADSLVIDASIGSHNEFDGPLRIIGSNYGDALTRGSVSWEGSLVGTWRNAGTVTATATTYGATTVENAGTFIVAGGVFGAGGTYTQSGGLTNVLAGAKLDKDVVLNGGTLKGKGTVRSLTNNGGIVEPGASPGTLSVTGNFAQTGGTLRIEVEPAEHDVLAVGGTATLGGALEVLGGLPSTPLRFLTAATMSGAWATVTAPAGYGMDGADTLCAPGAAGGCVAVSQPSVPVPTVSPTPTAAPVATATPAPTPAPSGPPPVVRHASARVVFPARCHRGITLRVTGDVRRATVKVNGKRVKTLKRAGTVKLVLRRKAKVAVAVTLTDGRTLTRTKTYRTC